MILLLLVTLLMCFVIFGTAYLISFHTEFGKDIILRLETCCICNERGNSYDGMYTDDGHWCHDWCEHILEKKE